MTDTLQSAVEAVRAADGGSTPETVIAGAQACARDGRVDAADAMLADGERRFPHVGAFVLERAHLTDRRGVGAAAAWARVRERLYDQSIGFTAGARIERDAGRLDEAAALLATARARFPEDVEPIVESGWLAHVRRDWLEAARWWKQVRLHAPQHVVGFVNGAVAAREVGDIATAETLLAEATRRFPDQAAPWIEAAALAQHGRRWAEAERLWQEVRDRFPDVPASHTGAALALREQGRFAEADTVLAEAASRFPADVGLAADHCWVAHVARDWPEAARRWAALRQAFPLAVVGYTSGAVALREQGRHDEADALLTDAVARFPDDRSAWTERAWLAWARRDWPEAARRWADLRARFPDFAEGYLRGAMSLAEAWDADGAEALLREGMARFPGEVAIAVEFAAVAMRQNRLDDAAPRYADVRARFPACLEGHLGGATVLRNRFRLDEAASALVAARAILPDEPRLWLDHAMLPVFAPLRRDRDPDETLRRLATMRARFPDHAEAALAAVRVLRDEGRIDEAAAIADEAAALLPDSAAIVLERGALALARGDWETASRCYADASARFGDDPAGFIGAAQVLAATGRVATAETALRDAIGRFPGAKAAHTAYAEIAMQREDWAEALARWSAAQRLFPDDNAFAQRIYDARQNMVGDGGGAADAPDAEASSSDPRATLQELVLRFESLGGRMLGCEFGMFQREFGAEPLGLLRWADMPYEGIIAALESRFEGVGLPENTDVFVNRENSRPEYCTVDKRGFMFMRAFVYEDEMPLERMRKQGLRRLVYLKDKLIADLEAGEKIFLWRCTERDLEPDEIARLHRAVRAYGDNWLLYVRREDSAHPNGTVEIAAPGLMIGYIDRFKVSPDGVMSSAPATASWLAICRRAVAVVSER